MTEAPGWIFYPRSGQYRIAGRRGRASQAQVLEMLDKYLATKRGAVADSIFDLLRAGQIDIREAQVAATMRAGQAAQQQQAQQQQTQLNRSQRRRAQKKGRKRGPGFTR